jgi:hypothetical protein
MSDSIFCSFLARRVAVTISFLSQIPNYFNPLQTAECRLKSGKLSKIEAKNLASKSESDGVEAINTSASSDEPSKGYMLRNWTQLIQAGNYVCDSANDFKYLGKSNIGMEFRVNCDEYVHNYKVVIRPNKEVYVVSE